MATVNILLYLVKTTIILIIINHYYVFIILLYYYYYYLKMNKIYLLFVALMWSKMTHDSINIQTLYPLSHHYVEVRWQMAPFIAASNPMVTLMVGYFDISGMKTVHIVVRKIEITNFVVITVANNFYYYFEVHTSTTQDVIDVFWPISFNPL